MKKRIIAIIPARGGSKGIPRKNIKIFAGKPLIAWTIEQALRSKYLDKVIVSTENREISKISKKYGAEVAKRPDEFATDTAKTIDVIFHLLDFLKTKQQYEPNIIVLLQPTSPLRTRDDIDNAIKMFLKNKCESVISFYESTSILWSFKIEKGYARPFLRREYLKKRRQDLTSVYLPNGAVYISTPKNLLKYKSFYGKKVLPYIMPRERSIDIDDEIDFFIAERLINNK